MPKREDKPMPDQPITQADLDDQVEALDLFQLRLALHWLATTGPDSEDGRALRRAPAAVRRIEKAGRP
jgi:hypothetical protein